MKKITVTYEGHVYEGSCPLSSTLEEFLTERGVSNLPAVLREEAGRRITPAYTLVHQVNGMGFVADELSEGSPVPALTPGDTLSVAQY